MKAQINMINVEDGDAIFVGLEKNGEKALIVIDGGYGKFYESRVKKRLDELLPDYGNKIRLMVCTHYDNDHLAGARRILNDYSNSIEEIWIHKVEQTLDEEISLMEYGLPALDESAGSKARFASIARFDSFESSLVLENYKELLSFMRAIRTFGMECKCVEAVRGTKLHGFEEFEVISPTAAYYNDLLEELRGDAFMADLEYNISEKRNVADRETFNEMRMLLDSVAPCSKLETSSRSNRVTATNLVSIVTLLTVNSKRFLFTGDAGIESFESNGLLDAKVEEIDWLQLPHHGSKNNTSKKMLEHFNPRCVFVSGKGGLKRPHYNLRNCLAQGRTGKNVYVTNEPDSIWYLSVDERLSVCPIEF